MAIINTLSKDSGSKQISIGNKNYEVYNFGDLSVKAEKHDLPITPTVVGMNDKYYMVANSSGKVVCYDKTTNAIVYEYGEDE